MKNIPRPEHPRPQWMRANWQNLNGTWQFEIDNGKSGHARNLHACDTRLQNELRGAGGLSQRRGETWENEGKTWEFPTFDRYFPTFSRERVSKHILF